MQHAWRHKLKVPTKLTLLFIFYSVVKVCAKINIPLSFRNWSCLKASYLLIIGIQHTLKLVNFDDTKFTFQYATYCYSNSRVLLKTW